MTGGSFYSIKRSGGANEPVKKISIQQGALFEWRRWVRRVIAKTLDKQSDEMKARICFFLFFFSLVS